MGLIDDLSGRRVYLDANIFIYVFEGHLRYGPVLQPLLRTLGQGIAYAVTSELTLAETLVGPLRRGFVQQAQMYQQYLRSRPYFEVLPVTRALLVEAAHLRATSRLKLPDAVHAATALHAGCSVFLTNDTRIKPVAGLDVIQLADSEP